MAINLSYLINNAGSAFSNPWWSAQNIYKEPQWTSPKTGIDLSTGAGLEFPSVEDGFYADPSGRKTFSGKLLPYFAKNMFQPGINLSSPEASPTGETSEEGTAAILNWDMPFSGKPLYEWAAMDPSKVDFAALDPDLAKLPADIQQAIRDDWDNYLLGQAGGLNLGGPSGRGDLFEYIPDGYSPVTVGKHGDPLRTHGEYSWRSLNGAQYVPGVGLVLPSKNYRGSDTTFMDKLVPGLIGTAIGAGIGQMAGLWNLGGTAGAAGAGGGGGGLGGLGIAATETGLSTLPTAGTWAHTAAPALGAGAGEWTLPSALSGISGATTTSGGLTLGEALGGSSSGTNSIAPIEDRILSNIPSGTSTGKETSLFNQLRNVKSLSDVEKLISNNSDKALDLASTLYGIYQSNQHKGDYEDLAKELMAAGDPFGSQRGQYQKMLSDSYSNPMSIYNSPEYQGLSDLYRKKIEAKDAAAGRRSQYAGRELEMQSNFLNYLGDKRKELATLAGAGISPNISNSASASTSAIGQSNDIGTNILGLMNSLFRTPKITRSSDSSGSSGGGIDP